MGTTRRVRRRLRRRRDRVLLGALRFPAFMSSRNRNRLLATMAESNLSLDLHILEDYLLYTTSMSIHTPRFYDDVTTDISI